MVNGSKFDGTLRSYKLAAKEYIYNFDKNQYYRDYKTKVMSQYSMNTTNNKLVNIGAIYDDYSYELIDIHYPEVLNKKY